MKRNQVAMLAGILLLVAAGSAEASRYLNSRYLNSRYLNSRYLNSRYLNTAQLNAANGSSTFYNPHTGATYADVRLDRSTFVSDEWVCDPEIQECWIEERRGDAFVGTWTAATLNDGTPSYTYIAGRWHPQGSDADTYLYWVYAWAQDTNGAWGWLPACNDGAGNMAPAMPLSGEWNHTTGARVSYGGEKFTWACTTGALGKCAASGEANTMGYAPWESNWYYVADANYNWTQVSGQRMHQTCTRMVRSDYCGNGESRTVDGTPIEVNDYLWAGDRTNTTNWFAEALWREEGAYWISCGRQDGFGLPINCTNRHLYNNGDNDQMCYPLTTLPNPEWVDQSPQRTGFMSLPAFDLRPGEVVLGTRSSNTNTNSNW